MRKLFGAVIVLVFATCVAQADVFYNAAAWNTSVPSATTINFEGIAASGGNVLYGFGAGASTTVGGVTFAVGPAGTNNGLFVVGDNVYYPVAAITPQTTTINGAPPNDLLITLPNPVTAVAFDFGGIFFGDNATITLSDGSVQTVAVPGSPNLTFFGVTAPGGITSVDITLPSDTYGIGMTDFSYSPAAALTPEPSFFLLVGVGFAGVIGIARRRQRTAPKMD